MFRARSARNNLFAREAREKDVFSRAKRAEIAILHAGKYVKKAQKYIIFAQKTHFLVRKIGFVA